MYIVEVDDNDREKDATRHLLSHLMFRLDLLRYLSLGEGSWVIMEAQKPTVFWFVGGTDPEVYSKAEAAGNVGEIPTNHNPRFAPVIHPTLKAGVEAMVLYPRDLAENQPPAGIHRFGAPLRAHLRLSSHGQRWVNAGARATATAEPSGKPEEQKL